MMQGVNKEDFPMCKEWHKSTLQRCDLCNDLEDDLMNSCVSNMCLGACVCIDQSSSDSSSCMCVLIVVANEVAAVVDEEN